MKAFKLFWKENSSSIIFFTIIAVLGYLAYRYAYPFKYIDGNRFTIVQRRQIVDKMNEIESDDVKRAAVEAAAKASGKSYRQELEEQAKAAWDALN